MLWLAAASLKALTDLAERSYPEEACALLVGRRGLGDDYRVSRIEPARNVAADRRRCFEVDPGLRIGLQRELRGKTDDDDAHVIGVWHSHPDGPARPSVVDAARVYEPDLVWLVTAVVQGQALISSAFVPARGGFRDIGLGLADLGE